MDIVGTVISVDKNMATVAVKRVSACGENCANCKGGCEATTAVSVAENQVGAAIGDTVKIESDSASVIRAAVVLYILPVLAAIATAVVCCGIELSDLWAIGVSVAVFFVCFFVIKLFEKKLAPKSYITKIIGKGVK